MDFSNNKSKRVAIIGASGYGGMQAFRLLQNHPHFKVTYLSGDKTANREWNELFPFLASEDNPVIKTPDIDAISKLADYVILSLPNGVASSLCPKLIRKGVKIVDLSADYRYSTLDQWIQAYSSISQKTQRTDSHLFSEAAYGLPEFNAERIKDARLVACPGCFPTASLLILAPFLKQGLIDTEGIVIDAKSGTSGAGKTPDQRLLLSETSESISPYNVIGHRHTSEIEHQIQNITGQVINVQFTPHLVPMVRGLLSTVYGRLRDPELTAHDCKTVLDAVFRNSKLIQVLPVGIYPMTKWVRYTNKAMISVQVDQRTGRIVLMSVIDNLIKGQAGQAIQCLNIMEGLSQEIGLPITTYYP